MRLIGLLCMVVLCGCAWELPPAPKAMTTRSGNAEAGQSQEMRRWIGGDEIAVRPLSSYCPESGCPRYFQSVVHVQKLARGLDCVIAASGTCGALQFTTFGDEFVSQKEYFDRSGALVAAKAFTDAPPPYETHYGHQLSCSETIVVDYCKR